MSNPTHNLVPTAPGADVGVPFWLWLGEPGCDECDGTGGWHNDDAKDVVPCSRCFPGGWPAVTAPGAQEARGGAS